MRPVSEPSSQTEVYFPPGLRRLAKKQIHTHASYERHSRGTVHAYTYEPMQHLRYTAVQVQTLYSCMRWLKDLYILFLYFLSIRNRRRSTGFDINLEFLLAENNQGPYIDLRLQCTVYQSKLPGIECAYAPSGLNQEGVDPNELDFSLSKVLDHHQWGTAEIYISSARRNIR